MKGGSCKATFVAWEDCVDAAKDAKEDFVEKCAAQTAALRDCMIANPGYYGDMLEGAGEDDDGDDQLDDQLDDPIDGSAHIESVADALAEFTPEPGGDSGVRVLESELVDDAHGYVLFEAQTPESTMRTLMLVADNPGEAWMDVLTAQTDPERWDDYYPIFRAMVQGWYNVHGDRLGIDLPESIS